MAFRAIINTIAFLEIDASIMFGHSIGSLGG